MPPRICIDTSVAGGAHDPKTSIDSQWVFNEAARGSLILLVILCTGQNEAFSVSAGYAGSA